MGKTTFTTIAGGELTPDTLVIPDNSLTANSQIKAGADIARAKMVQETFSPFPLLLTDARVWDSGALLPTSSASNDDLWLNMGTLGSSEAPTIETEDKASNAGAESQKASWLFPVPIEYDEDETFEVRFRAKMATIADTTMTIDCEVYECTDGAVGSDICTTSAQTLTASYANYDFTITDTGIAVGDVLLVLVNVTINDAATGSGVICEIADARVRCDTRG